MSSISLPDLSLLCQQYLHKTDIYTFCRIQLTPRKAEKLKLQKFKSELNQSINELNFGKSIEFERYVLQKLIRKLNAAMRKQRYWRAAKQINKLLDKCEKSIVWKRLREFQEQIELSGNSGVSYCPSVLQVRRVVCSILIMTSLINNILQLSSTMALYTCQQLTLDHFIAANLILLSSVAKIRNYLLGFVKKIIQIVDCLSELEQKLMLIEPEENSFGWNHDWHKLFIQTNQVGQMLLECSGTNSSLDSVQQQETMDFLRDRLKLDGIEFDCSVKRAAIDRLLASEQIQNNKMVDLDLGVSVQRQQPDKQKDVMPLSVSQWRDQVSTVDSLKSLADCQKQLKGLFSTLIGQSNVWRRKCLKLAKLLKDRWPKLVEMKRQTDKKRFQKDLEMVKVELIKMIG